MIVRPLHVRIMVRVLMEWIPTPVSASQGLTVTTAKMVRDLRSNLRRHEREEKRVLCAGRAVIGLGVVN